MDKLRIYAAIVTLYENAMRVLHWKMCGKNFAKDHTRFGDYYDELGEYMDQTMEQMLTLGMNPVSLPMVTEILNNADVNAITIDPNQDYDGMTANHAALQMFTTLHELALSLATDDSLPADVADVFMDHARYYRIEGLYKLQRTLTHEGGHQEPAPQPAPQEENPEVTVIVEDDE